MVQLARVIYSNIYREDDKPECKSPCDLVDAAVLTSNRPSRQPGARRHRVHEHLRVHDCQGVLHVPQPQAREGVERYDRRAALALLGDYQG